MLAFTCSNIGIVDGYHCLLSDLRSHDYLSVASTAALRCSLQEASLVAPSGIIRLRIGEVALSLGVGRACSARTCGSRPRCFLPVFLPFSCERQAWLRLRRVPARLFLGFLSNPPGLLDLLQSALPPDNSSGTRRALVLAIERVLGGVCCLGLLQQSFDSCLRRCQSRSCAVLIALCLLGACLILVPSMATWPSFTSQPWRTTATPA